MCECRCWDDEPLDLEPPMYGCATRLEAAVLDRAMESFANSSSGKLLAMGIFDNGSVIGQSVNFRMPVYLRDK